MRNLGHRSSELELMDTESVDFDEFHECLRQLEFINICTLAYRPTLRWLQKVFRNNQAGREIFILDVGSGGGDMLRQIWRWSQRRGYRIKLVGADLNPWSKKSAEEMTPPNSAISFQTVNVFSMMQQPPPDFIISSLFTHHLAEAELIKFIRWMDEQASQGWLINDLHRHPIAYYFIKFVTHIIPSNRLIRNDAAVSVARAFTKSDWLAVLEKAGIEPDRISISWYFPFRYVVACEKR